MIICRNVGSLEEGIEYNPQHLQLGGVYPELHLVFPTLNIHLLSAVPFRLLVIAMIDHQAMGVECLSRCDADGTRLLSGVCPELRKWCPTLNIHLLSAVPFRLLVIAMIDHNAMGVPCLCNSDTDSSRLLSGECPEVHVVLPTLNIHLLSTVPFRLLVQVRNVG